MLKNKNALITGSTSGIGLAAAHVLAKQGINLVLHGLMSASEGEMLAKQFADDYGINTLFDGANLSVPEEIIAMIERVSNQMGGIDILVNNAGIQHTESVDKFPVDKWNAIIAINLSSAFHTIQQTLPHMQQNNWGRIINIASVHGLVGSVNKSAYVAAKHGIVGLTKVVALENANNGITANSICPGWVETPLINKQIEDIAAAKNIDMAQAKHELITAKQPKAQMAQTNHIGELILFLCTDAASSITGSALPIDGAWTAQ
jgi:3-hydroxybutyrate dehydrogenase